MISPFTGGPTSLRYEKKEFEFRREKFSVLHFYYKCEDTGEGFTTEQLDTLNTNQLYNQYREKYSIPFPDEIESIRTQYNVPASKMADILGLGANSYRQYESGDIPTVANGRLILAAKDPQEFKKFLDASSSVLSSKELEKFRASADQLIEAMKADSWNQIFLEHIFTHCKPTEFTGYKSPSIDRITHAIVFFAMHVDQLWKTKLNKLLFYADFLNYKRTGFSICGLAYRAIQLGPVPAEYDKLYLKLLDDKLFDVEFTEFKEYGYFGEALKNKILFDDKLFTEIELTSLKDVCNKLCDLTSSQIVELSHREKGWIENAGDHELISYQGYAFDLVAL